MRVAGFPRLALSYAVNELGDNLGVVALAILVLDGTTRRWRPRACSCAPASCPRSPPPG